MVSTDNRHELLRIHAAHKSFDGRRILDGLSLTINRGEAVGIWGRNGSGKSTILKIAAGVLNTDNENAVWRQSALRVGYLTQDPLISVLPWFKAWKNVAVHSNATLSKRESISLLATFGFDGASAQANAYPLKLSGGTVQRLGWACATLPGTEFVILDEPFAEQDEGWCKLLCKRVRQLVRHGCGILLVSHEPHLLAMCCDRVITLRSSPVCDQTIRAATVPLRHRESWADALLEIKDFVRELQDALFPETADETKSSNSQS